MKTDRQIFLEFCQQQGVKPKLKRGSAGVYVLPPSVVSITYFGKPVQPPEITVYFNENDEWCGGTNWLWDERLPWIAAKLKRRKAERMRKA